MTTHHDKHHQSYADNFAKLVTLVENDEKLQPIIAKGYVSIIQNLDKFPDNVRTGIRNNGGGFVNHGLFWESMREAREDNAPVGHLKDAIVDRYGSFDNFKKLFAEAASSVFGSGWAWLSLDKDLKLAIETTPNQDSPLMEGRVALVLLDVWEHAYYLDHRNLRARYVERWWSLVDWNQSEEWFLYNALRRHRDEL
jgi:Fe-Mn family superoxide dismutase